MSKARRAKPDLAAVKKIAALLPAEIRGFAPKENDNSYTADNLFDLIDGGAEIYRELNVRTVVSRTYGKAGTPDILADIFDMGSSSDAYGAYHQDVREGDSAGFGRESELMGATLYFWKDRYFVSIVAMGEAPDIQRTVRALGKAIAATIEGDAAPPAIVRLLPEERLVASHLWYFHTWNHLRTRLRLTDQDILSLGRDTEGLLARYRSSAQVGARQHSLMLVQYPDEARATEALRRVLAELLPGADTDNILHRPNQGWSGAGLVGEVLVLVLDAPTRDEVYRLTYGLRDAKNRRGKR